MANVTLHDKNRKRIWAIPLSNSEHRTWQDSKEFGRLRFQWREVSLPRKSDLNTIAIAVAKLYHDDDIRTIQGLANGIYYSSRIRAGDTIVGLSGNNLLFQKLGIVRHVTKEGINSVSIQIDWITDFKAINAPLALPDTGLEVARLPSWVFVDSAFELRQQQLYSEIERSDEFVKGSRRVEQQQIISRQVSQLETQNGVHLSDAARTLLVAPLAEYVEKFGDSELFNRAENEQWAKSISLLLQQAIQDPSYFDREDVPTKTGTNRLSSFSILKALHGRWCSIPPFCRRAIPE